MSPESNLGALVCKIMRNRKPVDPFKDWPDSALPQIRDERGGVESGLRYLKDLLPATTPPELRGSIRWRLIFCGLHFTGRSEFKCVAKAVLWARHNGVMIAEHRRREYRD